ncbi:hypothetical protein C7M84_018976 [Penaeus vannamei]|uniref:Uncharacterized protein n=1 Tax=Penaeus vannamei TaxID=6689 RepID=A0A3R7LZG5_PENVA|nr:hypothetical protein C7M84_018976 [Penaeus vannamei]
MNEHRWRHRRQLLARTGGHGNGGSSGRENLPCFSREKSLQLWGMVVTVMSHGKAIAYGDCEEGALLVSLGHVLQIVLDFVATSFPPPRGVRRPCGRARPPRQVGFGQGARRGNPAGPLLTSRQRQTPSARTQLGGRQTSAGFQGEKERPARLQRGKSEVSLPVTDSLQRRRGGGRPTKADPAARTLFSSLHFYTSLTPTHAHARPPTHAHTPHVLPWAINIIFNPYLPAEVLRIIPLLLLSLRRATGLVLTGRLVFYDLLQPPPCRFQEPPPPFLLLSIKFLNNKSTWRLPRYYLRRANDFPFPFPSPLLSIPLWLSSSPSSLPFSLPFSSSQHPHFGSRLLPPPSLYALSLSRIITEARYPNHNLHRIHSRRNARPRERWKCKLRFFNHNENQFSDDERDTGGAGPPAIPFLASHAARLLGNPRGGNPDYGAEIGFEVGGIKRGALKE